MEEEEVVAEEGEAVQAKEESPRIPSSKQEESQTKEEAHVVKTDKKSEVQVKCMLIMIKRLSSRLACFYFLNIVLYYLGPVA